MSDYSKYYDIEGEKFGEIRVLYLVAMPDINNKYHPLYKCRCELCGKEFYRRRDSITRPETYSCGCKRRRNSG